MKTVYEQGKPVGSFPIPDLHLTNNQAWALLWLASTPSFAASLPSPDGSLETEWAALQAGLDSLKAALNAAGYSA